MRTSTLAVALVTLGAGVTIMAPILARRAAGAPSSVLLLDPEMRTRLGGQTGTCNKTKCVLEPCTAVAVVQGQQPPANACPTVQVICGPYVDPMGNKYCSMIVKNDGEQCNPVSGKDDGFNCSQSTDKGCMQLWNNSFSLFGNCVSQVWPPPNGVCRNTGLVCGSMRHICTQSPCP